MATVSIVLEGHLQITVSNRSDKRNLPLNQTNLFLWHLNFILKPNRQRT